MDASPQPQQPLRPHPIHTNTNNFLENNNGVPNTPFLTTPTFAAYTGGGGGGGFIDPSASTSTAFSNSFLRPATEELATSRTLLKRNLFHEYGVEDADNPLLHYLHVGVWHTKSCDYDQHRRPQEGEIRGHSVLWLHNARPRDRFVFMVTPVDGGWPRGSLFDRTREFIYGYAPRFAFSGRKKRDDEQQRLVRPTGVEIIEIMHDNVTAIDFAPGLVMTRFAIEASEVTCHWFATERAARTAYGCCRDVVTSYLASIQQHNNNNNRHYHHQHGRGDSPVPTPFRPPQQQQSSAVAAAVAAVAATQNNYYYNNSRDSRSSSQTTAAMSQTTPPFSAAAAPARTTPAACSDHSTRQQQQQQQQQHPPPITMPASVISSQRQQQHQQHGGKDPATPAPQHQQQQQQSGIISRDQSMQWAPSSKSSTLWSTANDEVSAATASSNNNNNESLSASRGTKILFPPTAASAASTNNNNNNNRATTPLATSDSFTSNAATSSSSMMLTPQHSSTQQIVGGGGGGKAKENFLLDSAPRIIYSTVVTCYTQDPNFTAVLRECVLPGGCLTNEGLGCHDFTTSVAERQRLLALVETGIPSWGIFFSRYGIFYRRSLRMLISAAINFWPLVALCLGLYDLYSHMPYVHEYLTPLFSLFEDSWIFRISLYVAYFFTYVLYSMQWVATSLRSVFAIVEFIVVPFLPLLNLAKPLVNFVQVFFTSGFSMFVSLWQLLFGTVLFGTIKAIFWPVLSVLSLAPTSAATATAGASSVPAMFASVTLFWTTVLRPVKNLFKALWDGIIHLGSIIARHDATLRMWIMRRLRSGREFVITAIVPHWRLILQVVAAFVVVVMLPSAVGYLFGVGGDDGRVVVVARGGGGSNSGGVSSTTTDWNLDSSAAAKKASTSWV